MSRPRTLVVVGTLASNPYAGMAWMHMQMVAGLRRLGHDAYYLETTSNWPYDAVRQYKVCDSDYAVPYLARVADSFGLGDRWGFRRSFLDKAWLGLDGARAEALLAGADAVFNVAGATRFVEEGLRVGNLVYLGTDPVYHELTYAAGVADTRAIVNEHAAVATFGENIGTPASPVPPLPNLRARTRQPILLDRWAAGPPARPHFTTVGNLTQTGREVEFQGETYFWSKDREFEPYLDLPSRVSAPLELAVNLARPETIQHGKGEEVRALGLDANAYDRLRRHGWNLVDAPSFTMAPWPYRDYVQASRGEFTVARDLNVRLRSGWFSERSACYLAAGRPVITQDTGFGRVLPTGQGLFAFNSIDDVIAAFEAIESDYARHSRAARAIAEEYFRAETVLARLLHDLGL